tara:strand:- start:17 stop:619 length:603 start_codon:yes stop_codon:yes gene_type:complete
MSTTLWLNPNYSDSDITYLTENLKKGDTFVDIGANIGHLSLAVSKSIGKNGTILAVEGNERVAKFLKKNIKLNKRNILVLSCIVGDKIGIAGIENRKADDMNQVVENGKKKMLTLDKICYNLDRIHLLKIDVEGFEYLVLKGGLETLLKTDRIFIEIIDELLKKFSSSSQDVFSFLNQNNFILDKKIGNSNYLFKKKNNG